MSRSKRPWIGLALPAALAAPAAAASDDEVGKLLARARAACGVESFRALAKGRELLLHGTSQRYGVAGDWTLRLAADGRYVRDVHGELSERDGCDGHQSWHVDSNGVPFVEEFALREHMTLEIGVTCGDWCVDGGPLLVVGTKAMPRDSANAAASGVTTLRLRARDGLLEVELDVDSKSALPMALRWSPAGDTEHWSFSSWRPVGGDVGSGGLMVPGTIDIEDAGNHNRFDLEGGELLDAAPGGAFSIPSARPADTTFDPTVASRLPGRLARSGHVVVQARIGGQELGSFLFDSGFWATGLAPKVVDALKLERFGEIRVGGGGAERIVNHFVRSPPLTIGPATVTGLRCTEFDVSGLEQALGEKFAGVVGYDLLQRVVAVVSMKSGTVDLFDPKSFARDNVHWTPLLFHENHAHVRATFEHGGEEEGVFLLDTGAPRVNIIFHSPAVRSLGLLDGDQSKPVRGLSGVGGQMRARTGRLDGLTVGGRSFESPSVILCEDESGSGADPWITGIMGGGILESFDVIFDYPHARIGFVEHEAGR